MKKILIYIGIGMLLVNSLFAQQELQSFNYQAVIRNASGVSLSNEQIKLRISIIPGDAENSLVFSEIFDVKTNEFGLMNIKIGTGEVEEGVFSEIKWGSLIYFLKLEIYFNNDYETVGISQLSSVPFAMHAKTASSVENVNYKNIKDVPSKLSDFKNDLTFTEFTFTNDLFFINFNDSVYKVDLSTYNIKNNLVDDLTTENSFKALTAKQGKIVNDRLVVIEAKFGLEKDMVYYASVDNLIFTVIDIVNPTLFNKVEKSRYNYKIEFTSKDADKYFVFVIPNGWDRPSFYYTPTNHSLFKVFEKKEIVLINSIKYSVWVSNVKFPISTITMK